MRSLPVSFAAALAVTAASLAGHADGVITEERPIEPPAPTATLTHDRPAESPSPQSIDDGELEYRLMVRFASLDPYRLGDVHAHAVRGAVTLYGTVADGPAHDQALVVANTFGGVRVVRDELDVRPRDTRARGGGPVADDPTITVRAQSLVNGLPVTATVPLRVLVHDGVVRVEGTVATYLDARRVASALKTIPGVIAVRPELRINEAHIVMIGDPNANRAARR